MRPARFLVLLLALAAPAYAATTPTKKPLAKPVAAAAPAMEPQPDANILIGQARDAQNRGEGDLAIRLAQSAIVADPARPSTYDVLADVYLALNQPEAARSYYGEALSIDPSDASAQRGMAALDRGSPRQQAAQQGQGTKTATP